MSKTIMFKVDYDKIEKENIDVNNWSISFTMLSENYERDTYYIGWQVIIGGKYGNAIICQGKPFTLPECIIKTKPLTKDEKLKLLQETDY